MRQRKQKQNKISDGIKKLVVVSDLHCGSKYAILPPDFELDTGNKIVHGNNAYHKWIWQCWTEAKEWIAAQVNGDEYAFLGNGDMIEGIHHRSNEHIMTLWEEHLQAAEQVLAPIVEPSSIAFFTLGTECHTLNLENTLASRLGAHGGLAKNKWLFDINGCLVDAAHHMVTTKRSYLAASGMGIEMGDAINEYAMSGHRVPKVFFRGHRHKGGTYSVNGHHFAVTGAWQGLTRYGHKVVGNALPVPSVIVADFTDPEFILIKEKKFITEQDEIIRI